MHRCPHPLPRFLTQRLQLPQRLSFNCDLGLFFSSPASEAPRQPFVSCTYLLIIIPLSPHLNATEWPCEDLLRVRLADLSSLEILNCGPQPSRALPRPLLSFQARTMLAMNDYALASPRPRRASRRRTRPRSTTTSLAVPILSLLAASLPAAMAQQCIPLRDSTTCPAFSNASISTSAP
jgi:hypothetical protein